MPSIASFKERLAVDFSRKLNRNIRPKDITMGRVGAPKSPTNRNTQLDITIDNTVYSIYYDRANLASVFNPLVQIKGIISIDITLGTVHKALPKINAYFGTNFTTADLVDKIIPEGTNLVEIAAASDCPSWTGTMTLRFTRVDPTVVPPPLHEFAFNGTNDNTGTSGIAMAAPMTYKTVSGRTYAHLAAANGEVPFGNNLKFKVCGDYTFDMVLMVDAAYGYNCLFAPMPMGSRNQIGAFYFYSNQFYEYGVGSAYSAPAIGSKVPARITVCSRSGTTGLYINGKKVYSYPSPAPSANRFLEKFRDTDSIAQWPTGCGIDYLKYWDVGLSDEHLNTLFKVNIEAPTSYWKLETDVASSTPSKVSPMGGTWSFETVAGEQMAKLGGTGFVPFPDGMELPITGDFYYEFDLLITAYTNYLAIMSPSAQSDGYNSLTTGSIYLSNGIPYIYGGSVVSAQIPLNKPVRLSFVGRGGRTEFWQDGVKKGEVVQPVTSNKLRGWRSGENVPQLGNSSYVRRLRYVNGLLMGGEIDALLAGKVPPPSETK